MCEPGRLCRHAGAGFGVPQRGQRERQRLRFCRCAGGERLCVPYPHRGQAGLDEGVSGRPVPPGGLYHPPGRGPGGAVPFGLYR